MTNAYIVGAIVSLQDLIVDPSNSNAPVTGATVTATVYLPDKSTDAANATEVGGGVYSRTYQPETDGWYEYVFSVPEGQNGQGAQRGRFYVAPVP